MLVMCMVMHVYNTATFSWMQHMCMAAPDKRKDGDHNHQNLADHSAHPASKAGIAAPVKFGRRPAYLYDTA